jgi:hypothetical protein
MHRKYNNRPDRRYLPAIFAGDICRRYLPAISADDICRRYLWDTTIIEFEHLSYHVITVKLIRSLWAVQEFSTPEDVHRIEITR